MEVRSKSYKSIQRLGSWALLFAVFSVGKSPLIAIPLIVSSGGILRIKNWGRVLFIICAFTIVFLTLVNLLSMDEVSEEARRIAEKADWNPAYVIYSWEILQAVFLSFFLLRFIIS